MGWAVLHGLGFSNVHYLIFSDRRALELVFNYFFVPLLEKHQRKKFTRLINRKLTANNNPIKA